MDGYREYVQWVQDASVIVLTNDEGEQLPKLSPKKGNIAYANSIEKKVRELQGELDLHDLYYPLFEGRKDQYLTYVLFFTLTFDHNLVTPQEAWNILVNEIKKFKIQVRRDLQCKCNFLSSPEGTSTDYPAPHMTVILEKPVKVFRHKSTFKKHPGWITYRLPSTKRNLKLKSRWKWGHIDIQAPIDDKIVDTSKGKVQTPLYYQTKYMTKYIKIPDLDNMDPMDRDGFLNTNTGVHTIANQKVFGLRSFFVSSQFRKALLRLPRRLERTLCKSQHIDGAEEGQKESSWRFLRQIKCPLSQYCKVISTLPPPSSQNSGIIVKMPPSGTAVSSIFLEKLRSYRDRNIQLGPSSGGFPSD